MTYNKSQIGWTMIAVFTLIPLQISLTYFKQGQNNLPSLVYIILMVIMVAALLTFYKLKVKADHSSIKIIFGVGLVNFTIRPKAIEEVKIIETPWYFGLGIRVTPKGMLYNVHGLKAVQITYLEGNNQETDRLKTVTIGTRDPENFMNYLNSDYLQPK
jgi:hypothetical protein